MGCSEKKLSKNLTQIFMVYCNVMICQQATLSGEAERPKVADAVIEASISMNKLLTAFSSERGLQGCRYTSRGPWLHQRRKSSRPWRLLSTLNASSGLACRQRATAASLTCVVR